MAKVYLSVGSNMGDRARNIARAIEALPAHGVKLVRQSSLYETEPVEVTDQPWFLNGAVEVETDVSPGVLLQALLAIERELGRERRVPKGPRLIDMDILLYDSKIVAGPEVEIPHPRMPDRRFVLLPLAEIAPEARHPVLHRTIAQLADETADRSEVRRLD